MWLFQGDWRNHQTDTLWTLWSPYETCDHHVNPVITLWILWLPYKPCDHPMNLWSPCDPHMDPVSPNVPCEHPMNPVKTLFNKIAIQGKCPDGKWTRKPLAYRGSNIFHVCVICPHEICVNLVFLNIFTLLSVTQLVDNLFHSFIVLCENEYFLISNLH